MKLICVVLLAAWASLGQTRTVKRQVDTEAGLRDAFALWYYPTGKTIPTASLDPKGTMGCGASGTSGYYMQSILGQATGVVDARQCLATCYTRTDCFAVNYLPDLQRCVFLGTGSLTDRTKIFYDGVLNSFHYMFTNCAAKSNMPALPGPDTTNQPTSCGVSHFPPNIGPTAVRIVGGTEAKPYSWPWTVRVVNDNGDGTISICGGTLVHIGTYTSSTTVITAAHCVVDSAGVPKPIDKMYVLLGSHDNNLPESREIKSNVSSVTYHSAYNTVNHKNDIAVIKLPQRISFNGYIRGICLPASGAAPKDPSTCIAAGWGRISNDNGNTAKRLQQTPLPILADATCGSSSVWGSTFDSTTMTCAGFLDGSKNVCNGDSGGPLICYEDNHWVLFGATSFGNLGACAYANRPGVFARVSAYRSWIDTVIGA